MADIQLKVNTGDLANKAAEISDLVSKIENAYDLLKRTAEASTGYWEGDAANAFRRYAKGLDNDMRSVLRRLGEHPADLVKMAGIYEKNEAKIIEQADTLPIDVIS